MLQDLTVDLLGWDVTVKSGVIDDVTGLITNIRCFSGFASLVYYQAGEEGLFWHNVFRSRAQ